MSEPTRSLRAALAAVPVRPDELAAAYREAAADLAGVRSDPARAAEEAELQALVARAHARLFRPPRPRLDALVTFVTGGWVRVLVRRRAEVLAAAGLFALAALAAFGAVLFDPPGAVELLSPAVVGEAEARLVSGRWQAPAGALQVVGLATENGLTAVETIAYGVSFGIGSAWSLIKNGAFVGALYGVAWHHDASAVLATFMVPHAPWEFLAIVAAGAGGLTLGGALAAPGRHLRRDALREVAPDVLALAGSSMGLLLVAACIEGLISPHVSGLGALLAALIGAMTLAWFARRGLRPA